LYLQVVIVHVAVLVQGHGNV